MTKRRILSVIALVVVAAAISVGGVAADSPDQGNYSTILSQTDGTGTTDDPHVITNVDELQAINASLGDHYVLGNDIDAVGTEFWNGGAGFDPLGKWNQSQFKPTASFTGTFDGNGYSITGLYINRSNPVGLFLNVDGSQGQTEISNLTIEAEMKSDSNAGVNAARLGTISAFSTGETSISNVDVFPDLTHIGSDSVGGLIGEGNLDQITDVTVGDMELGSEYSGIVGTTSKAVASGDINNVTDVTIGNLTGTGGFGFDGMGGIAGGGEVNNVTDVTVASIDAPYDNTGGIAGLADVNHVTNFEIGDITGGGAAGISAGGSVTDVTDTKVGNINSTGFGAAGISAGGSVTDVTDTELGDIDGAGDTAGISAGASVENVSDVQFGDVTGERVGGISTDASVTNVKNIQFGDVTGKRVGGISTDGSVTNLNDVQFGDVTASDGGSTSFTRGAGGISTAGAVENVSNIEFGDVVVEVNKDAGGITARSDLTNVTDVHLGDVISNGDVRLGGLTGGGNLVNVHDITVGDVLGDDRSGNFQGMGGLVGDGNLNNVSNVRVETVRGGSAANNRAGGVVGETSGVTNVTGIVIESIQTPYLVIGNEDGGTVSNSIFISDDATFYTGSSVDNSTIITSGVNGDLTSSYTNDAWYDANGEKTDIESFTESTADDTWEQNPGNLDTPPIVPGIDLGTQLDLFPTGMTEGIEVTFQPGDVGDPVTGTVDIDTGVTVEVDIPVVVEMTPDEYNRVSQETLRVSGTAEYEFSFDTTERDFGNHTMVATVGGKEIREDFEIEVTGGSAGGAAFSVDVPGTGISIPVLPVGAILLVGSAAVGYVYYRRDPEYQ